MKRLLAATCALSFGLIACVKNDDPSASGQDIDRAIPTSDQVAIKLPETATRSVGQLATFYVATRGITQTFNGASAWVLVLIHAIVQAPPTSVKGNVLTWGPGSDALSPADYRLDVTVVGDGTFKYALSGRSKTEANADFEVIIDGTADPRAGEGKGSGEFVIDFDASKRVNPVDSGTTSGSVDVHYDLAQRHLDLAISSTDASNAPVVADYSYTQAADGGGDMVFSFSTDIGGGPALENATLRSRWEADGAGRGDARVSGGDLGAAQATASECWDTMFKRVFYTDSVGLTSTEGAETACVFTTADLPLPQ